MASRPLGEVGVAVDGTIDPLLKKFADAKRAADDFDRHMRRRPPIPIGGGRGGPGDPANDNASRAADRMARSFNLAARAAARYHQQLVILSGDLRANAAATQANTAALERLTRSVDENTRAIENNRRGIRGARDDLRSADTAAGDLRRTLLASASVIVGAFGANEVKNLADSYTRFTNQLKVAGLEGNALSGTQETLFNQAQKYGVQLESLGTLYGRLAQSQTALGATSGQMIQFTNGVAAAIKVQGAGANEVQGALLQLSQAMGSPIVRAEEFNSINEGARPILQAVANGIDRYKGSVAALRNEVVAGKVTSQEFFQGFLRGSSQLEAQSEKANLTIGASFQTLNNALGRYIGQTDKSLSATQRVGGGIKLLADNLHVVMPILTAIIIAMGSRFVAAAGSMIVSTNLVSAAIFAMQARAGAAATTMEALAFAGAAAGRTLLAAFGGPLGIAMLAIAGAVYYFHQRTAAAAAAVEAFNQNQKEATQILADEQARANAAAGAIRQLGSDHNTATSSVKSFAGATGDAAKALDEQARAARRARFDLLALAIERAKADKAAADQYVEENRPSGSATARFGIVESDEVRAARLRSAEAQTRLTALELAAQRAVRDPLESYVPNARTQGRDIAAEIADLQRQLVAAERAHNISAQKELLKQIKIRQNITRLMAQGLSFEIANAQAQTEGTAAPRQASSTPEFTGADADRALGGIGATVTSRTRSRAKQQQLYDRYMAYKSGSGPWAPVAARPGHSNHESGLARDVAKTPGMSLDKIRQAIEGAGGQITELLDEGSHFHVAWRKNARSMEQVQQDTLSREQAFGAQQQQLNDQILSAREQQLIDEAEISRQAIARVNGERDRTRSEIDLKRQRGDYTEAQARELTMLNDNLRTEQVASLQLKERQRLETVMARTLSDQHDRKIEQMQAEEDMARTATQRRAVERRILAAQEAFERQTLQATIDSQFTKPEDRARAQAELSGLGDRYRGRRSRLDRDAIGDMYGAAPEGSRAGLRDQQSGITRERDDRLATVDEGTTALLQNEQLTQEQRERILQEAADRRVAIEMDAAKRILDLETERKNLQLQNAEDIASGLASIAEGIAGKQSSLYRGIFATAKAFAIAQASIALYQNVAEAMKYGFPQNLPFIAAAVAQGATVMSNIQAISGGGFKQGGFTGYGNDSDVAGPVHRNEYVFDAGATRRIGRQNLDAIRAGRDPTANIRATANDNGGLANAGPAKGRVTVKQMPGVAIEYRESMTTGDIEIIAQRAVQKHAPGVVAADMDRPNGKVRKSVQRNTTARGRKG